MIKILRVKDVAKILNITPGGVRQRVRRGQLPARKLGGSIIFLQDELEEYVTSSLHLSGELPASQRDIPSPRALARSSPPLPPVRWVNPIALVIGYHKLVYKATSENSTPSGCVCISSLKRRGLDANFILKGFNPIKKRGEWRGIKHPSPPLSGGRL